MTKRKYPGAFGYAREDIETDEALWSAGIDEIFINPKIKFLPWQKKKLLNQLSNLIFCSFSVSLTRVIPSGEIIDFS